MPDDFFSDVPRGAAPSGGAPDPGGDMGGQGSPTIPYITHHGMRLEFPNVDQPQGIALDHVVAKASEDLRARLNDLDSAVTSQMSRDKNTSAMDKLIGSAIGLYNLRNPFDDPLAGERGNIWRTHRQYAHNQQMGEAGGEGLGGGYPTERDAVFTNAGSTRQAIQAWIMAQSKARNMNILRDVQNHMPFETDTDELHKKKIAFWDQRLRETDAELRQRGIYVPSLSTPRTPDEVPGHPKGAAAPTGPTSTSGLPDGFRATKKWNVKGTPVIEDDKGTRYYFDSGSWNKLGG